MRTVICHFYNEEYLLPFWLNHHKRMFEKGIMINYRSTDRSVDIIKEICPDWEIIDSSNENFGARELDAEVGLIEKNVSGWRIVLNVTEFLIGDLNKNCNDSELSCRFIPSAVMVCPKEMEGMSPDPNRLLCEQFTHGIYIDNQVAIGKRGMRRMSSYSYPYNLGRHYSDMPNSDLVILWYRNSPYNQEMIKRNLQIQERIPQEDKAIGFGYHHIITEEGLKKELEHFRKHSSNIFSRYKRLTASLRS